MRVGIFIFIFFFSFLAVLLGFFVVWIALQAMQPRQPDVPVPRYKIVLAWTGAATVVSLGIYLVCLVLSPATTMPPPPRDPPRATANGESLTPVHHTESKGERAHPGPEKPLPTEGRVGKTAQ